MVLYIDLDSREFSAGLAGGARLHRCALKRGDTAQIRVQFVRGYEPVTLEDGAVVKIGLKEAGKFDGDFLAASDALAEPVDPATEYAGPLNLNTEEIDAVLLKNGDASDDLEAISCLLEVTWSEDAGDTWMSSVSLPTSLANDVVRGDEGTPQGQPTPDDWLSARAVRYDAVQTLTSDQKAQARTNIGATAGAGAAVDSVNGQTGAVVLDPDDLDDASTAHKFVTATDLTKLSNLSGTNTGDQDLSGYVLTGDSRLTDARTPTAHTHGGISNAGAIGVTSGLPIKTGTSGVLEAGSFGTGAGSFCEGNDSRLSDARTPTAHTHEGTAILSTGEVGGSKFLREDGDGTCSWQTISGGGDALVANPLSQFAATTSDQLAGVISDETGTGALVFANSPTLVTPALGTPASGTLTNCAGLPAAGVTGLGTLATQSGTFSGTSSGTNTGDQDLSGLQPKPSEGQFANGDKTKLDGIEALADVTDAANVKTAIPATGGYLAVTTLGTTTGSVNVDLAAAKNYVSTPTGNITLTATNLQNGTSGVIEVRRTGSFTLSVTNGIVADGHAAFSEFGSMATTALFVAAWRVTAGGTLIWYPRIITGGNP